MKRFLLFSIALLGLALGPLAGDQASAQDTCRKGKVLIIRGLFTVFSLGLDELGNKLEEHGLEVQVVPAIWSGVSGDQILSEYIDNPDVGPIVIIGHSRGGDMAPVQARKLGEYGIPVDLIVIVDTIRDQLIPANVERCVNIYTTNMLGIYSGEPVTAESDDTELLNLHVDDLDGRENAGFINHFNIDSSDWIHDRIVQEVLSVCPSYQEEVETVEEPTPAPRAADPPFRTRFRWGAGGRRITLRL